MELTKFITSQFHSHSLVFLRNNTLNVLQLHKIYANTTDLQTMCTVHLIFTSHLRLNMQLII